MKEIALMKKQAKKYLDTTDEKVVKIVYAMLEADAQKDWWDDVSDEAKASIERGLNDAEAGRVIPHKEAMKKYKKWLVIKWADEPGRPLIKISVTYLKNGQKEKPGIW